MMMVNIIINLKVQLGLLTSGAGQNVIAAISALILTLISSGTLIL